METIRTIFRHPIFITGILFSFLNLSCNSINPNDTATDGDDIESISKSVFKGVMFGDGEFAAKIPAISNNFNKEKLLTADQLSEYREIENQVISYIDDEHPKFWDLFYQNISNPNPLRVKQALEDGALIIKEAFIEKYAINIEEELLEYEDLSKAKKESVIKALKEGNKDKFNKIVNTDIASISAIPNEQECVYQAIAVVSVAAVALAVYAWAAVARWQTITYPEAAASYIPSNTLADNEIIGQISNYFSNNSVTSISY